MTVLRSDFSLIDNAEKKHAAWGAFKDAMRGKAYGHDALNQAWRFIVTVGTTASMLPTAFALLYKAEGNDDG